MSTAAGLPVVDRHRPENQPMYVETHYAASPRARDRAIAGLSMGGVRTGNSLYLARFAPLLFRD
nr:hypothetical protein [Massilia sp. JS1662]